MVETYIMENVKNRRRTYRMFLSPRVQLRHGMYYAGIAIVSLVCFNALTIYLLIELINTAAAVPTESITQNLLDTLFNNRLAVLTGLTVLGLLFIGLAVFLSKNIVGPTYALLRHIEALKAGNYEHKTTLRKRDDLKSLMVGLNELSDTLKERHGNSKKSA